MPSFEARFAAYCDRLDTNGQRRRLLSSREPVAGKILLADFSHNDYLGLANDPAALEAGHATGKTHGVGATGSRLLSGNLAPHTALEAVIAAAKGTDAALVFNSGYQANAGALAALLDSKALGAEPLVFADRLNHASLHHACQLMGVRQQRYRHNDMAHLRELLEAHRDDPRPRFIVAETVFGMDGDTVDMAALTALAEEFDAFLYLDEAHATGVLGEQGYGLASGRMRTPDGQSLGAAMGTFSKALGAAGAYVACSQAVRDYLLNRCSGFIYSTAPSPLVIGAVQYNWQRLPQLNTLREQLLRNAQSLRERLHALGFDTGTSSTHIVPVIVGAEQAALDLKQWLLDHGILVSAIRPPTVPPHTARIRVSLSAAHTAEQIDALIDALATWKGKAA